MRSFNFLILPFVVLLLLVSGSTANTDKECDEYLWNVVGRHFVPRKKCDVTVRNLMERAALREKYHKELSQVQDHPDEEKINEILDRMMTLLPFEYKSSIKNSLMCTACWTGVEFYKFLMYAGASSEKIIKILANACTDLKIMSPKVCNGTLELYGKTLTKIIDNTKEDANFVCSMLLNAKCGLFVPEYKWNVTIPKTKKPPIVRPTPPPESAKRLKVLHISDTHWDTEYEVGSWAECKLPLCCRSENVLPDKNATRAGKYGGWRCDTPEETFDSMLKHISKQHPDIDYIIWTGDIPAHDIWEQTQKNNLDVLKKTVAKLSSTFRRIPLFPALGNHESVPSNMFPTGKNKVENPMDWLYNVVSDQWSRWLPKNTSSTIRKGAFYTTLIRPGFRIVSMNMNYCYKMNWWLIEDSKDPMNELQWFAEILQQAEDKNEKVHVIGHVPVGSNECVKAWQTNYYNIINRYEGTVTSQFFGHTHSDEFEIFYDMKDTSRPFGVAYIGPSLTTYMYHNPSYRIYYVEGDYKDTRRFVLDHETWYLDLEKANQLRKDEWKKLYSAKSAYQMNSLYPEDWHNVYLKIKNTDETLQLYHKFYWNDSPKRPACGESCRRARLCEIRSCDQYGYPNK